MTEEPVNAQLVVALAIVGAMTLVAIAVIVAAAFTHQWGMASTVVSTIVGALAVALNAPTGIANALKAALAPKVPE